MAPHDESTLAPSIGAERPGRPRVPGLIHVFSAGVAAARAIRLPAELGRNAATLGEGVVDPRVSRRHAAVRREGARVVVTDLGSQNGTVVDGVAVAAGASAEVTRVLRIGDSLFVPSGDVEELERRGVVVVDGFVRGPAMQAILDEIGGGSRVGPNLHIHGESGTGKEGVARAFHVASGRGERPFIAVNCATVPEALAERLFFGSKRGAYSGADADAPGYLQSADGGTLFLDEVVELDLAVQAKLLRALEAREVVPLGASLGRRVDVHVCSATHRDLRALVAAGKLREDLFFRIGRPEVRLPPLRQRPEEVAVLLQRLAEAEGMALHASLVEACLLRPWPGNVRELLVEAGAAMHKAAVARAPRVEAAHLAPGAGSAFAGGGGGGGAGESGKRGAAAGAAAVIPTRPTVPLDAADRAKIEEALRATGGNVTAAARALGVHRTQLRRILARHGIAAGAGAGESSED